MNRRSIAGAIVSGSVLAVSAAAGLLAGAGTSAADPATLTLTYTCPFPLIGNQQISVAINADVPATATVGEPTPEFAIEAVATVPETATAGLNLVGAKTVEGTAQASAAVDAPEASLPVTVPTTIAPTEIPASGAFDVTATGTTPSLTFTQAGEATVTVGDLLLTLHPKTADGSDTGLGTFDSQCTQDAGQDNTLATVQINEAAQSATEQRVR
ncbi:hypothetical protein GCM10027445_55910 [Amycolatopsis endophytica]|uniref:DUF6801 domain-containing protein n=1 Tax=Amycolatopsis endophytica TaxID=860233 RepID=A0A853BC60_9PSEU|nr:DUF6801 domain-containing protein [Amycolatopsis endophytica]NYI92610.1 hypothetical protein [Amycolatopsis endophytica]